jgi:mannosyltransferase
VGMYDPETGLRLVTRGGEGQVWLEPLAVDRPSAPAPAAALGMQHNQGADFGELALLGYDAYKLGYAYQPDVPLQPGDVLHVNLYWQARAQPSSDWQVVIDMVGPDRREPSGIEAELVGGYPTSQWQAEDVWRGQFNLPIPADAPLGRYRLQVQPIAPDGTLPAPFLSGPLTVGP